MGSSLGAQKSAAKRAGISLDDYQTRRAAGQKWCIRCKAWHSISMFGRDASRSDGRESKCMKSRATGQLRGWHGTPSVNPKTGRSGPEQKEARSGDKIQARYRVNKEVQQGKIPSPRDLPCTDCLHVWVSDTDRRHEYDHYLGYDAEHHLSVQPVCVPCHRKRERSRRNVG